MSIWHLNPIGSTSIRSLLTPAHLPNGQRSMDVNIRRLPISDWYRTLNQRGKRSAPNTLRDVSGRPLQIRHAALRNVISRLRRGLHTYAAGPCFARPSPPAPGSRNTSRSPARAMRSTKRSGCSAIALLRPLLTTSGTLCASEGDRPRAMA